MPALKKKRKKDEIRKERLLRKRRELRKATPEKMAALRQKFLNQAKKYYGYPYAKKYWAPDSPEYKSKLFLDCCGLVRKVMRDLVDDFGFIMGPWNQAYMFDTLPINVPSKKEMKPGDLVFVSAIYYNPKSKKQRHNMTHVEIWAGEGNKTVGARWNNGKVQLFDSYKFTAKSYHSETYHFKSIDTWLRGICKSFCPQHRWKLAKYNPKKKSIFAVPEEIGQADQAAGDDDDNVDNFLVRGNTFCQDVKEVKTMVDKVRAQELKRPKTEMDLPTLCMSGSANSLDSVGATPRSLFPPITNDMKNMKAWNQNGADTKGKNDCEGDVGARNLKETNGKTCLSLDRSLTDLGKKGFYLKDLVDTQKDAEYGTAFDEDDEDDFEEADDDLSDDDAYLADETDENEGNAVEDDNKNDYSAAQEMQNKSENVKDDEFETADKYSRQTQEQSKPGAREANKKVQSSEEIIGQANVNDILKGPRMENEVGDLAEISNNHTEENILSSLKNLNINENANTNPESNEREKPDSAKVKRPPPEVIKRETIQTKGTSGSSQGEKLVKTKGAARSPSVELELSSSYEGVAIETRESCSCIESGSVGTNKGANSQGATVQKLFEY
ncbi:uncharacterized protein LOC128203322 isoform X2 [Mya arenaria]|uniref:uncharacterized protein LOC128203322 isoform X2 n=1 Tax=Mya arenaria TaxID=6604 RepID=UPI0022E69EE3|nr:uncharacterized protein LOC128203322 isoform X2 [Mya arenaria]